VRQANVAAPGGLCVSQLGQRPLTFDLGQSMSAPLQMYVKDCNCRPCTKSVTPSQYPGPTIPHEPLPITNLRRKLTVVSILWVQSSRSVIASEWGLRSVPMSTIDILMCMWQLGVTHSRLKVTSWRALLQ
jgi:hypothetical protein